MEEPKKNILLVSAIVVIAASVAGFLVWRGKTAEIEKPVAEEQGLGAEIYSELQNPLREETLTANPFTAETNPFIARANPFEVETNPLKGFYKNPFQ